MAPVTNVYDLEGTEVDTLELPSEWFDAEVKPHVMHEVVTAQLAAARQGTHKTKTRGQVRGGGRKPFRQKGTGRARQGSIRSPQWVGGGIAHGRTPSNWAKRVNKKLKRSALRSALTDRVRNQGLAVVRGLAYDEPKTKAAVATLTALGHAEKRVLVVLADKDTATQRSFRNLPTVRTIVVDQLNTYDVLRADVVVFDESSIELIGTGRRAGSGTPSVERTTERQQTLADSEEVEA